MERFAFIFELRIRIRSIAGIADEKLGFRGQRLRRPHIDPEFEGVAPASIFYRNALERRRTGFFYHELIVYGLQLESLKQRRRARLRRHLGLGRQGLGEG